MFRSRSQAMFRSNSMPQRAPLDGGRGLSSSCRSSRPKLFIGLLEIDALEAWQLRVREAGDSSTNGLASIVGVGTLRNCHLPQVAPASKGLSLNRSR